MLYNLYMFQNRNPMIISEFLKRKNIVFSAKRYGIDAMSAMAQGLFASLLIGTIINTIGNLTGWFPVVQGEVTKSMFNVIGGYGTAATGAAMAVAIGFALKAPALVLFTLCGVGAAANALGGAGGPLAVLIIAAVAAEFGKAVSKETRIDIIVTPFVTLVVGVLLAWWIAPAIGKAASAVGTAIYWATNLQPFWMGMLVSIIVGITGGLAWVTFGSHYIFYAVAALSLVNLVVAIRVKDPRRIEVHL